MSDPVSSKGLRILFDPVQRNVLLLATCQAFANTGTSMLAAVAALAGHLLADDKSLATLPLAVQWTATMCTSIPASQLMRHVGRRAGLSFGAVLFIIGGGLGFWSIQVASFGLFIVSSVFIGSAVSFIQFYRFAAVDSVPDSFRGKAVSLVLAGGVVAAVMGGEVAKLSVNWFLPFVYAGCYVAFAMLGVLVLLTLQGVRIPGLTAEQRRSSGRPMLEIARQPVFIVAVLSSAFSFACMILVMTATPLAMEGCGFGFNDTATVIQWHVLAMYAPSFITGTLVARFGELKIITVGVVLITAALGANVAGIEFLNFWAGLVLIGVGWNFMFVGGTTLLAQSHTIEERAKVQGANDFIVFTTAAAAAFGSGALYNSAGWNAVNFGVAPVMLAALIAVVWVAMSRQRAAVP